MSLRLSYVLALALLTMGCGQSAPSVPNAAPATSANDSSVNQAPHTFTSETLDAKVLGFSWADQIKTDRESIKPENGFRLIRFQCELTLKGDRQEVSEPRSEFRLLHKDAALEPIGVYAVMTSPEPHHWGPLGEVKKEGLDIFRNLDVFFSVPAAANPADLKLSGVNDQEVSVASLPVLKAEAATP